MTSSHDYDVIVVGGGPAGATAATQMAGDGHHVLLVDPGARIKPCGGAVPPRLIDEFNIPRHLLVARINKARIISPTARYVDMPIDGGYVGMVDRKDFDEALRVRAAEAGAERQKAAFVRLGSDGHQRTIVQLRDPDGGMREVTCRFVVGADGANSQVASQGLYNASRMSQVIKRDEIFRFVPGEKPMHHVAAYHEIIEAPRDGFDPRRCDVFYDGTLSPDFYAWVFPHGDTVSVGVGTAQRGFPLRQAVSNLRERLGLGNQETVRREGAPIPLHPLRRWDNGHNVIVAGDAAGVVAPASGEGIYYAMASGRMVGRAVTRAIETDNPKALRRARTEFMREHAQVFRVLAMMQRYWYTTDNRRERFVRICEDKDVQLLTWRAYMDKRLVRAKPLAHLRIFFKNMGHLTGLASA
jgi:geranylgeranyl diphosphate/geranylgeranyl-bacteriochlorophyllide a reductase